MIIHGCGIFNSLLNKLPVELHIPGYQFCGPGTKLAKRLSLNQQGINGLDNSCKDHDIAYSKYRNDLEARRSADLELANKAWDRVQAKDSSFGEKIAAYAVNKAMMIKRKLGMGLSNKGGVTKRRRRRLPQTVTLSKIIKEAKKTMKPGKTAKSVITSALKGARLVVKKSGGKNKVKLPRIIPVPSSIGGALPFIIPLFAGLSATGALAGGAAGVAKAINDARAAKDQLRESVRHNKHMEAIAIGKGLRLAPYKSGWGLRLKPYETKGRGVGRKKKSKTKRNKRLKKKKISKKKKSSM